MKRSSAAGEDASRTNTAAMPLRNLIPKDSE